MSLESARQDGGIFSKSLGMISLPGKLEFVSNKLNHIRFLFTIRVTLRAFYTNALPSLIFYLV